MITVMSRRRLRKELEKNRKHDCVILFEPDHPADVSDLVEMTRSHCAIGFHDIITAQEGFVLPTAEQLQQVIDWAECKQDILVSCRAGVSRSSAVAYLLHWAVAGELVLDASVHIPNALVIELSRNLLGRELFDQHVLPDIWSFYEEINEKYKYAGETTDDRMLMIRRMWQDFTPRIFN